METDKENKEIQVSIETFGQDEKPHVQIKVQDKGPGIREKTSMKSLNPSSPPSPALEPGWDWGLFEV